MRLKHLCLTLSCFAILLSAAAAPTARIDLISFDRKTLLQQTGISEGGNANPFSWEKDGGKWGLSVNFPAAGEFRDGFVKIRPEGDMTLIISLMGPDVREGGVRKKVEMEYSACSVNGDDLLKGKKVVAWHDKRHDLYAKLRKGEEYTIAFTYREYVQPVTITAGAEFRPIDMTDLRVRPGSALDFSSLLRSRPITEAERLTVRDGRFVLASAPAERVRLTGCAVNFRGEFMPLDKEGIREYVALVRRQGYNMIRAHYLDAYLMWGAKADFEFVPEYLDRFFYLVACMKEAGVYLSLDAMSANSGYRALKTDWSRHDGPSMGGGLLLDPEIREEWKRMVAKLLLAVNPYTGTRLVDDPVVVNIVAYNEQDHFFVLRNREVLIPHFGRFLIRKYGSEQNVLKAYGPEFPALDRIGVDVRAANPRGVDSREFLFDLYRDADDFYLGALREIGFNGYVSQLDCDSLMRFTILRNAFPVIAMHGYHAHPDKFIDSGSRIEQTSSVRTQAAYLTGIGGVRFLDRPFLITEINHVFWNRYRYEQGLLLGAYSAYQDYDGFIPHSGPALFRGGGRINPFGVGADPVCRASDVVTNFLIHGDVLQAAPRSIEFEMEAEGMVRDGQSELYPPDAVRKGILFARSGIRFRDLPAPAGIGPVAGARKVALDRTKMYDKEYTAQILRGLLDNGNPSRPEDGYFVTDTREISLDSKKGDFRVTAPKLEGATSVSPLDFRLPHLGVKASVPGSAAMLSLDGKPLAESRRLLLVIVGDALNENMMFADTERTTLLKLGKNPLLQTMKAAVTLKNGGTEARCRALRLNGEPQTEIPVRSADGSFSFEFDTAVLPGGPALFFELEIK